MNPQTVVLSIESGARFFNLSQNLSPKDFDQFVKWNTFVAQRISEGEIRSLSEMKKAFVEFMYTEYRQDIDIDFL